VKKNPSYFGPMQTLVSPEWQYIHHEKLGTELYDWRKDMQQLNNLAATPAGKSLASEFAAQMQELLRNSAPGNTAVSTDGPCK
jgi:hypothetical protein